MKVEPVPIAIHHPNCNIAKENVGTVPTSIEEEIRDNDSLDLYFMSPDAYRAAEAIDFISEHLRNEDQYIQVSLVFNFQNVNILSMALRYEKTGSTWPW